MNNSILIVSFRLAFQTFRKNLLRVSLTVFGIMIGIAMVVIVLAAGAGVKGIITAQISSFGNNWVNIEVKVPDTGKNSSENAHAQGQGVSITTLTRDNAEAIRMLSNIKDAYAGITTQSVVSYQEEKTRPMVFGVTASYPAITTYDTSDGRFFTEGDDERASQVVVLGSDVKEKLFGNQEAVGASVKIDSQQYRVIGVMKEIGSAGFFNMDEMVYLPLKTVQKKMMGINHVSWIVAEMRDPKSADATAEEIQSLMREQHDITDPDKDDFAVTTMQEAQALVGTIITALTWLLVALAAISLGVGGVGIMNVMYVSVAERTFEIGLRKAVGATDRHILLQFLIEAMVMTLAGGLAGMVFGIGISALVSFGAQQAGYSWPFHISIFSIILSVGFSTAVGIFFGLYPAKRASELDPMVAIRQE